MLTCFLILEVSIVLDRFIRLWNEKNLSQFEAELNNLPPIKDWLFRPIIQMDEEVSFQNIQLFSAF